MVVFLDFDGVLHPRPNDHRGKFCHLERFERVLRRFSFVNVVISSSWRETYPEDVIIALFSEDIQARILGVTPVGDGGPPHCRYNEILKWLELSDYVGCWIALDDAELEFPLSCPNLLACSTNVGFDDMIALQFEARLRHASLASEVRLQ